MVCDRCNCYSSFWTIFYPFTPLTCLKNEYFKKMKEAPGDIIILQKSTKNHDYMQYCLWDMAHGRCNCYFWFWAILCPFTPLTAQKIKISKKWKKRLEISSFTHEYQKLWLDNVQFLRNGAQRTDRQTVRKSDT